MSAGDDDLVEVRPEPGWYLLSDDPQQAQHWDGRQWSGEPVPASRRPDAKLFPGVRMEPRSAQIPDYVRTPERTPDRGFPDPPVTNWVAVVAFICSCVGLWFAGIPLGIHAQREIEASPRRYTGKGFATAAIIIGVIAIVITFIIFIAVVSGPDVNDVDLGTP